MQKLLGYTRKALKMIGVKVRSPASAYANPHTLQKASVFIERFREIVADPLNILIERVPQAGYVDRDGCVILHNGNRVPVSGDFAYYSDFSDILIINRWVHEPLEEFCFQEVLKKISTTSPVMIELGAYWSHYSMWLKKRYTNANCFMVEPSKPNLEAGQHNFRLNGYKGEFLNMFVRAGHFRIDDFLNERRIDDVDVLHSDIQGFELEMLQGASAALSERKIKYVLSPLRKVDFGLSEGPLGKIFTTLSVS